MTKASPIIFDGERVRAILLGLKTQPRRLVKPQPLNGDYLAHHRLAGWQLCDSVGRVVRHVGCPFGEPGELLWVRESFWQAVQATQMPCGEYESYWAGAIEYDEQRAKPGWHNNDQYGKGWMAKRPSIHMPRRASRLTLRVTGVRVERLQEISDTDAIAEGCGIDLDESPIEESARPHFSNRWDRINGKRAPWDTNPWVWVVEFDRVDERSKQ